MIIELQRESEAILGAQDHKPSTPSEHRAAQASVRAALSAQSRRYHDSNKYNSRLTSHETAQLCKLTQDAQTFFKQAANHYQLSARAYFKTIKVAQTIADLEAAPTIAKSHIAEALQYRPKPPT